jgi:hypothetical protein
LYLRLALAGQDLRASPSDFSKSASQPRPNANRNAGIHPNKQNSQWQVQWTGYIDFVSFCYSFLIDLLTCGPHSLEVVLSIRLFLSWAITFFWSEAEVIVTGSSLGQSGDLGEQGSLTRLVRRK